MSELAPEVGGLVHVNEGAATLSFSASDGVGNDAGSCYVIPLESIDRCATSSEISDTFPSALS